MLAALAFICAFSYGPKPVKVYFNDISYPFQSAKLSIEVQLPDEWKSKFITEETDNSIVFKYGNPGGQPAFLFSINKISDVQWMNVKDQLSNAGMLIHAGNTIYYYEKTDNTSIKGANKDDYKSVVAHLDEVIKTAKSF
jgi:hypothetical protein